MTKMGGNKNRLHYEMKCLRCGESITYVGGEKDKPSQFLTYMNSFIEYPIRYEHSE